MPQSRIRHKLSRNVRKPLVIQRTLLPKNQVSTSQIVTLALVPGIASSSRTGSFLPVVDAGATRLPLSVSTTQQTTSPLNQLSATPFGQLSLMPSGQLSVTLSSQQSTASMGSIISSHQLSAESFISSHQLTTTAQSSYQSNQLMTTTVGVAGASSASVAAASFGAAVGSAKTTLGAQTDIKVRRIIPTPVSAIGGRLPLMLVWFGFFLLTK